MTTQPITHITKVDQLVIRTDDMQMRAWIDLNTGEYTTIHALKSAVLEAGICYGINMEALQEALVPAPEQRQIVLAEGKRKIKGNDAYVQSLIETEKPYEVREDGSVDFHAFSAFVSVEEGMALIKKIAAGEGEGGMTVTGALLPAEKGEDCPLDSISGNGTEVDGNAVVAACGGIYTQDANGKISVMDVLIIDGDLDLTVGNIDTNQSVHVRGDIKAGFSLKSEADITIDGVIEDSRVSAGGSLLIGKGILPGKNRVKARKDLVASYVRDREVKAGSLVVKSAIVNSCIKVTGMVTAKEITGGTIYASTTISACHLGNAHGEPLHAVAGVDVYKKTLYENAQQELVDITDDLERTERGAQAEEEKSEMASKKVKLLVMQKTPVKFIKEAVAKAKKHLEEFQVLQKQKIELEKRQDELHIICKENRYHPEMAEYARVIVTEGIFPGVEIGVGEYAPQQIITEMGAVVFRSDRGQVVCDL